MTRIRAMFVIAGLIVALSGCSLLPHSAAPGEERPTIATQAEDELGALPGVGLVSASQTSIVGGSAPSDYGEADPIDPLHPLDPLDPDDWSIDLEVTLDQPTADELVAAAEAVAEFSGKRAGDGPWAARVRILDLSATIDPDLEYTPPLQVEVYPYTLRRPLEATVRSAFAVTELPGVASVAVVDGLPWVRARDAAEMTAVYAGLRASPLWEVGGSLQSADGRVRIMDVPERQAPAGVDAILAAATAFPAAQFWLEAPTLGPRWPQLYIDRVDEAEAAAITAMFTAPAMAAANTETFVLPFTIRATGPAGPVDTVGTFGGVPSP